MWAVMCVCRHVCHTQAQACLSTGWALNRCFAWFFGTAAVLAQGGGRGTVHPHSGAARSRPSDGRIVLCLCQREDGIAGTSQTGSASSPWTKKHKDRHRMRQCSGGSTQQYRRPSWQYAASFPLMGEWPEEGCSSVLHRWKGASPRRGASEAPCPTACPIALWSMDQPVPGALGIPFSRVDAVRRNKKQDRQSAAVRSQNRSSA